MVKGRLCHTHSAQVLHTLETPHMPATALLLPSSSPSPWRRPVSLKPSQVLGSLVSLNNRTIKFVEVAILRTTIFVIWILIIIWAHSNLSSLGQSLTWGIQCSQSIHVARATFMYVYSYSCQVVGEPNKWRKMNEKWKCSMFMLDHLVSSLYILLEYASFFGKELHMIRASTTKR